MAAAWRGLKRRMAADAGLKAEVEAPRIPILAAGRAQANAADPTLQQLALAALEARGHMDGQAPEGIALTAPAVGPIDG